MDFHIASFCKEILNFFVAFSNDSSYGSVICASIHWRTHIISNYLKSIAIFDESFGNHSLLFESLTFVIIRTLEKVILILQLFFRSVIVNIDIERKRYFRIRISIFFELIKRLWNRRFGVLRVCMRIWEFLFSYPMNEVVGNGFEVILILIRWLSVYKRNKVIMICFSWFVSFKILRL